MEGGRGRGTLDRAHALSYVMSPFQGYPSGIRTGCSYDITIECSTALRILGSYALKIGYSYVIRTGCSSALRILGSYETRIGCSSDIRTGCSYDIKISIVDELRVMSRYEQL